MNNLYSILTNKGYSVQQVDEIMCRIAFRLPINYKDQEEIIDYIQNYVNWNLSHMQEFKENKF